jgi:hypothetical protein
MGAATLGVRDLIARAADAIAYARWAEQVAATGYCAHPVRLIGNVNEITLDTRTGEIHDIREIYATDHVLLRRATPAHLPLPICSQTHRRDACQRTHRPGGRQGRR